MKEWMRKHHGYQPGTSPMHWNFASYSTSDTPISQACKTVSRSHDSCWISTHWTYCKFFLLFLSLSKGLFLLFSLSSSSCNSKNVSIPLFLLLSPLFLVSMFSLLLFIVLSVPILLHPSSLTLHPLTHPPHSSYPSPLSQLSSSL